MSVGLKLPPPWDPQLFQRRRQGTKARVEVYSYRDTEVYTAPVRVHHSNLLWYNSAPLYPKETEQVPKGKHGWLLPRGCFKGWISQPSCFSLVLSIVFHCSLSVCLFGRVSLFLIYSVIPVCTEAGGSNTRLVLCA